MRVSRSEARTAEACARGRPHYGTLTGALVCVLCGCKPATTQAPYGDDQVRSLAEVEAALQRNEGALRGEGVYVPTYVAQAELPAATVTPPPATEQDPSPPEPVTLEPAPPDTAPPEPEPDDDAQDMADEEDLAEPEAFEPAPAAPMADAPREERRAYRRSGWWDRWIARRRSRKAEADRCQRICDLADATCDLQDQICALAERHPDEPRYEDACLRAELQCEAASSACDVCSGAS